MCRIHNCKLNVTVKGEGQGILLLHGWGQNAYMMKFLQDHLCEHYKVVNLVKNPIMLGASRNMRVPCMSYVITMK